MIEIPELDARALLTGELYCLDCPDWSNWKLQKGTVETGMGLVDSDGIGVQMQVSLRFHRGDKTNLKHHLFTVYKQESYGLVRIYQLEVRQWPKKVKDAHQRPHEHWGDKRFVGDLSWADWTYEQILAYFAQQTRIKFQPNPPHPEFFELK